VSDRDIELGSPKNYIIFGGDSRIPIVKGKIFRLVVLGFVSQA
jgi:hypothetical protein